MSRVAAWGKGTELEVSRGGVRRPRLRGLTPFVAPEFGSSAHWFAVRKRPSGCCLGLRGGGGCGRFGRGAWRYYGR